MSATTIRTLVLAVLSLVNFLLPLPEDLRQTVADHATTLIGAILGLWAAFAAHRAYKEAQARKPEVTPDERED